MTLRKILAVMVVMLALPLTVFAAGTPADDDITLPHQQLARWIWPELGLAFNYPVEWQFQQQEGFEFMLLAVEGSSTGSFLGVQTHLLGEGEALKDVFAELATQSESEMTTLQIDGVNAVEVDLPAEGGLQLRIIGYIADSLHAGVLLFGGSVSNWAVVSAQIDTIIDSMEITPLLVDEEALDAQLLESFEEDETLRVGDSEARIKMVEVLDFSCPHCASYATSVERLIQDYVVSGDMQIELRLVTFIGDELSVVAANAEYCAVSMGFGWQMHNLLFGIHIFESPASFTVDGISAAVAETLDVDAEAFAECLENQEFNDLVLRDGQIAHSDYDVTGTPSVLIGIGDAPPEYILNQNDEPVRGGIRLIALYNYLDDILADRSF